MAQGPTPRGVSDHPIVRSAIERSLASRVEAYEDEVQRLVDATYRVIERTASLDPTVRVTLWGLLIGAAFMHLVQMATDQVSVQRYLTAERP